MPYDASVERERAIKSRLRWGTVPKKRSLLLLGEGGKLATVEPGCAWRRSEAWESLFWGGLLGQ